MKHLKWLLPWNGTLTWVPVAPLNERTPLVRCVWHHWLPRLIRRCVAPKARNYAVTLPRIAGRGCDVLVAEDWMAPDHVKHEAGGHGDQIERMQDDDGAALGKASYTATYLWHVLLRRGVWKRHMMERGAERYRQTSPHVWPYVWRGGVAR